MESKRLLGGYPAAVVAGEPGCEAALREWHGQTRSGDYVAIQAFLAPTPELSRRLQQLRTTLGEGGRLAPTLGGGPRFLHSTGQLHKGGPDSGLYLQLVDRPGPELTVPETEFDFGSLIRAQADGDLAALCQRGRRVLRVDLGEDAAGALERLSGAL